MSSFRRKKTSKKATVDTDSPLIAIQVPIPEPEAKLTIERTLALVLYNLVGPPYLIYAYLAKHSLFKRLLSFARRPPIGRNHSSELLEKALDLPSSRKYIESNALEYQRSEGHCSFATQRVICKSIPAYPVAKIPSETSYGPTTATAFAQRLTDDYHCQSSVVYGSAGYDVFIEALKKANDADSYRVTVNFLRSSLFGIPSPTWLPSSWFTMRVGGHFSPVLGYLEKENLVAIFDVNHKYGIFLCDTERLYDSVSTVDMMRQDGQTRGLVVTEILEKKSM